jgi:cupin fold WbuC family metalloprotein
MTMRQVDEETIFVEDQIVKVTPADLRSLKERCLHNRRKRIRLCVHTSLDDRVHEMLIILAKDTYIRPHFHRDKSESFHMIEGNLDVVVFDKQGNILDVVEMGDHATERTFYYRLSDPHFHTPLIRSEIVVFHETTNGPFRREDSIFAAWAPEETDLEGVRAFMGTLERSVNQFLNRIGKG